MNTQIMTIDDAANLIAKRYGIDVSLITINEGWDYDSGCYDDYEVILKAENCSARVEIGHGITAYCFHYLDASRAKEASRILTIAARIIEDRHISRNRINA